MNNVLTGEIGASASINNYKIVIIGDINVGKTSILSRFRYGSFEPAYMPTLGIDFFTKNLFYEDKTIRLILWDTAGQERFRSLIPSYLKNADCIIIVFDITSKESFNSLNHWLNDAKENTVKYQSIKYKKRCNACCISFYVISLSSLADLQPARRPRWA